MAYCTNCANLLAENTSLRADNARLQIEVAMLRRIIEAARGECEALATEAEQKQRGHIPTGVWAYTQAQKNTARKVLERLS